ncbi:MAG: GNAT family N-acetyltransferase [Cytophagaceae bacterium]|jgi:GNAT superfamily N-acetyltransferase|nr:GNAT family N-acetyltransferase [Cytophagaceae bacterium]
MFEYRLVSFSEEHTETMYDLIKRTLTGTYSSIYNTDFIDYFLSYNEPCNILSDSKNGHSVLCFSNRLLIGTGCVVNTNIRRVFVLPEYQRNGIGAHIVKYLEDKVKKNGLSFVELYAMLPVVEFYKKLCYTELFDCIYKTSDGNPVNYMRMIKLLR